jgi:hypothetical protein
MTPLESAVVPEVYSKLQHTPGLYLIILLIILAFPMSSPSFKNYVQL